ncbi:7eca5c79-76ff-497f-a683-e01fa5f6607c [Thermothielavioides terrestris]|uniref:7eca5c79-76ff-497f-a683-e01fa5f6607c n=1 Tax=Thermothielavioides terrestris TaxID=2587410 RepID=A0A3S4F5K4_9PEZI|nr:7eca5c79-76ff-497f-a683-e01fa5f6607c [Thermothielavioides terrestris]
MTPRRGRSAPSHQQLGHSDEAFRLQPLVPRPAAADDPRARRPRTRDPETALPSHDRTEPRPDDPHGRAPEATVATADQTQSNSPSEPAAGSMTRLPPPPSPLLRSAAGFTSPSYGSITPRPSDDSADEGVASPLLPSRKPSDASASGRSEGGERGLRRRRDSSQPRSPTLRRQARQSEELGGSTIIGGLEGRFGTTETPLLNGLADHEEGEGQDDARSYVADSEVDEDEDPPDNSPYAQVRASVSPTDNTSLSINTPRMWALSILFSILGSATNLFFSLRYPSVAITPVIALLMVHPLGLLWDYLLKRPDDPPEEFLDGCRIGNSSPAGTPRAPHFLPAERRGRLDRLRLWLAQGCWNEKEHTCVYVSSNVSFGFAFATDVIVEQTQFYKQEASITYQLLLTLSTQILGYTFAGLTRRFLVRPSGMIWPGTLMSAAMFTTLHKEENKEANGWRISRWKFFYVVWLGAFLFYFLPGLLMPALSYFNVVTWFAPDNVVIANLFGVVSGLGLFPMTFDWAQVAYIGSPLLTPFWAAMNVVGGLVVVMWIIAPIAYYSNWLYSSYMPILSAAVFDNTGNVYDVSKVLTKDFLFDREAYSKYSRVFLPITYVLSYGVQFAGLASLVTHTLCWHGRDIWTQWKRSLEEPDGEPKGAYQPVAGSSERTARPSDGRTARAHRSSLSTDNLLSREDVHNRLMRRYKDAPMAWYLVTFASMTAIGIFVVEYYPVHLPWYGLLLALGICAVLFIPIGIIMAVTNQHSSIYLICQLIAGIVFPGRPVANMVFVTYGYISSAQGIKFAADLKLGHYMKIPPRILFAVQVAATTVSSLTQIAVLNWMFAHVPGLCTPQAVNGFTCPIARVHFNGSILWGVVGPAEFFGPGALYRPLVWAFAAGALLPLPLWLYARNRRRRGASLLRRVNLPVLFGSLGWIPPATGLNFSVWALVCYVFNRALRRRAPLWWAKYTMTLSAALDSGLAFGIVVVFFGFVYPGWMRGFSWWGTEVYKRGCDWRACAYRTVPEGGRFGPDVW